MHDEITTSSPDLTAEELELLAYLLEDEGVVLTSQRQIPRRDPNAEVPLSLAQERMWFLDQWDPGNPASNIPFAVRLSGPLAVDAFERSINAIVQRHESLRTTFVVNNDHPQQMIAPAIVVPLHRMDLRGVPEATKPGEVRRLMMENALHRFDLARGPLIRADLLQLADHEHVFLLNIHHIVFDAWSVGLFMRELTVLYDAFVRGVPSPLPELPVQYPDYAIWQRERLQGDVLKEQLEYWKRQLGGKLPILELPGDRPRPAVLSYEGAIAFHLLPPDLSERLSEFSQREGCTLFMTLFAAFQTLLYRYTDEEDIITATMMANRDMVDIEELLGFFVNTLLLRTNQAADPTFRAFLAEVRETALEGFANQNILFEQLVEELKPPRDTSHTPLFQVMFILQNAPVPARVQNDLRVEFLRVDNGTSKYDLTLSLTESSEGVRIAAEYRTALFDGTTIARMLGHYQTLLEGIIENPDRRLSELPLMTPDETRLLAVWNATAAPYPREAGIHTLFAEQAARTPEAVALIDGAERVSFAELDRRSNQLAQALRARGVGLGTLVGVCLTRSATMVAALLGILKAGAAYLPLDPRYPTERLALMLEDAGPAALLTDPVATLRLPAPSAGGPPRIDLAAEAAAIAALPTEALPPAPGGASLAYIAYTSGSTGRPKGVRATHQGLVNRWAWMQRAFPFAPGEACAQKTALSFVDSVWEIFGPLLAGCPLVFIPDDILLDIDQLVATLAEHAVSRLVLVPALLEAVLQQRGDLAARLPALKLWVSSGEALPADLCARFHARLPGRMLLNLYGSSEVAADATWYVTPADPGGLPVPIGRPIDNMQVYLLDRRMRPVPVGVPGEIYIGGDGLAEGYHQRPDLTAERFIPVGLEARDLRLVEEEPNQASSLKPQASRLYKTGDVGRYRPDGAIEYLGRSDRQIKLRGVRIELEEIEAVLAQHRNVRTAVVLLREDRPGDPYLAAYILPHADDSAMLAEMPDGWRTTLVPALRAHLQTRMPDYMVPSAFVVLDAFPLTPSGKIDRRALPAPDVRASARPAVPPRTPVEKAVSKLWADVLGREPASVEDNFFEVGGHSLKATQLITRLREVFHIALSLRDVFQATTVAALAQVIISHQTQPGQSDKIAQTWLRLQSLSPEERQRMLEQMRKNRDMR
ncbi:MAG: hypothetical protein OHK0022_51410 [Roseiflexaceae bacterium]